LATPLHAANIVNLTQTLTPNKTPRLHKSTPADKKNDEENGERRAERVHCSASNILISAPVSYEFSSPHSPAVQHDLTAQTNANLQRMREWLNKTANNRTHSAILRNTPAEEPETREIVAIASPLPANCTTDSSEKELVIVAASLPPPSAAIFDMNSVPSLSAISSEITATSLTSAYPSLASLVSSATNSALLASIECNLNTDISALRAKLAAINAKNAALRQQINQ
jgi:hypothetical protein